MATEPIYPDIEVKLTGTDGNAMAIMGRVTVAMHRHPEAKPRVDEFLEEAMSGDYDNVLRTCIKWVSVS